MEFTDVINQRFSSRAYSNQEVEQEKIDLILEAGRIAPTACNRQPFKFVVIKTEGKVQELKEIFRAGFITEAPIILGIFAKPSETWVRGDGHNYYDVDAAIAFDHMILAAADLGLGTCWIGSFNPTSIKEFIGLDKDYEPVAFSPLGYSADIKTDRGRKEIEDLVVYY